MDLTFYSELFIYNLTVAVLPTEYTSKDIANIFKITNPKYISNFSDKIILKCYFYSIRHAFLNKLQYNLLQ